MGPIRVSDFARKVGCSPQNIYKHIRNYAAELEGHLERDRRGLVLDDYAQDFIRGVMYPKEISADSALREELESLRSALFAATQKGGEMAVEIATLRAELETSKLEVEQTQKRLTASQEEQEAKEAALQEKTEQLQASEARYQRMMNRGLIDRIRNKEVE